MWIIWCDHTKLDFSSLIDAKTSLVSVLSLSFSNNRYNSVWNFSCHILSISSLILDCLERFGQWSVSLWVGKDQGWYGSAGPGSVDAFWHLTRHLWGILCTPCRAVSQLPTSSIILPCKRDAVRVKHHHEGLSELQFVVTEPGRYLLGHSSRWNRMQPTLSDKIRRILMIKNNCKQISKIVKAIQLLYVHIK